MTAFWIDHEYDRDNSSDGKSRYGSYLRRSPGEIDTDNPARFAADCWRIANGPIMAPGYVRQHPRIQLARIAHNTWDGTITGFVTLITGWPSILQGAREWKGGARWYGWPTEYTGGQGERYYEPSEEDLTTGSYLMCSAEMAFPVPMDHLPHPPTNPRDLVGDAQDAVAVLVSALNQVVEPVIAALERS